MKYKKEDDMMFLLRKKTRRAALGKATAFTVRNREVTQQDIVEYFARKGGLPTIKALELEDPPTPSHISYFSPPPSPPLSLRTLSPSTLSPTLSRQPSPPQHLQSAQALFFSIHAYFDGAFSTKAWTSDLTSNCISREAGVSKVHDLEQLFSTAQAAGELIQTQRFVEARRMLSRTCTMIHALVADEREDPRSLEAVLQIMLHLRNLNLLSLIKILQNYLVGVAGTLVRPGSPERMWVKVCRMIGQLEPEYFEDAIGIAWRCTSDSFERNLGALHETTLLAYIDYIVWIHGSSDHATEEALLRELLVKCNKVYGVYSEMVLTITSRICESLYEQKLLVESEAIALDVIAKSRVAGEDMQLMLALELASMSEYDLGKFALAERNLREGIEICANMSATHPWVIKNQAKLEVWLREWGRGEEADQLKITVDTLIGRDEIDEEGNGNRPDNEMLPSRLREESLAS
jgi:hypothetical protein